VSTVGEPRLRQQSQLVEHAAKIAREIRGRLCHIAQSQYVHRAELLFVCECHIAKLCRASGGRARTHAEELVCIYVMYISTHVREESRV
jgi:hypothetical protein